MTRRRGGLYEIIGAAEQAPDEPVRADPGEQPMPGNVGERLSRAEAGNGRPAATQPAVFLDRDGTIITDTGFIDSPQRVELLPSAAAAISRLNQAGYLVVVASNQSGVARGMFGEEVVRDVNQRIQALLAEQDAQIDAFYHCPYLDGPDAVVDEYRKASTWRKPEPGMLHAAAEDLGIDLSRSWMIGDAARDVEAGRRAGCQTILVGRNERARAHRTPGCRHAVRTLIEAVDIVERDMSKHSNPSSVVRIARPGQVDDTGSEETVDGGAGARAVEAHATADATGQGSASPPRNRGRVDRNAGHGTDDGHVVTDVSSSPDVVERLTEIRNLLDANARRERQTDFSLLRLVCALLQMLAVVAAIWGIAAVLSDQGADATPKLLLACFLQFAAATAMLADRFR